jgi:hypothetical protein
MDRDTIKDSIILPQSTKLSDSEDYYNNVFKKTERIISATLYILSFVPVSTPVNPLVYRTETTAFTLHERVLASLSWSTVSAARRLSELQHALVSLQSHLELLAATGALGDSVLGPVRAEVDATLRYIKNHFTSESPSRTPAGQYRSQTSSKGSGDGKTVSTARPRRVRPTIPANDLSSDAYLVYSDLNDRATRIKTVLDATPNATIKDLSDVITDVSSKTIQRELNSLIEKGEVKRDGERRWSTYSLIK